MADTTGKRDRSPAFPQLPLSEAVERLTTFERYFGRHPAPLDRAAMAWGLKQAGDILASLRYFGLIEYTGKTDDRKVALAEEGRNLLRAQQESVRLDILRRAALRPKEIAKFWSLWGADRPPDPVCIDELVLRNGFSDRGAPLFLRSYDATIAFAGLSDADKIAPPESAVADYLGGPARDDETPAVQPAARRPPPPTRGLAIMDGERELTTGLLSKDASFRLIVSGHIGVREIERLIKKLQFDKEILADEDKPPTGDAENL
jgi:hypothetical protein